MNTKGKFIVFEGIDGCGKSTQSRLACEYLTSLGYRCVLTSEPTDGEMGKLLRRYLKGEHKADARAIAALFAADRADHITKDGGILSLLSEGVYLLCDRYYLSSCAYQGIECDLDFVLDENAFARKYAMPDLTVYIDITPEVAIQRVTKRGEREIFEDYEKLKSIYANYDKLLQMPEQINTARVNGERAKDEIANDIKEILNSLID